MQHVVNFPPSLTCDPFLIMFLGFYQFHEKDIYPLMLTAPSQFNIYKKKKWTHIHAAALIFFSISYPIKPLQHRCILVIFADFACFHFLCLISTL